MILAQNPTRKKQGVSGESSTIHTARISLKHFEKDFRYHNPSDLNMPKKSVQQIISTINLFSMHLKVPNIELHGKQYYLSRGEDELFESTSRELNYN